MTNIVKITALMLFSFSLLNASECSSEQRAKMIKNDVEQSVIDDVCSSEKFADGESTQRENDFIQRDRIYIALNLASGSGEYKYEYAAQYTNAPYTTDIRGKTTSLSLGYVFDSNNRFEISSCSVDIDEFKYMSIGGVSFDWMWVYGTKHVETGDLRAYFLLGFASYTVKNTKYDISGDAFGLNLGVGMNYPLNNSFEIDLGYHIKSIAWVIENSYGEEVATESIGLSSINLSLRFKF